MYPVAICLPYPTSLATALLAVPLGFGSYLEVVILVLNSVFGGSYTTLHKRRIVGKS